MQLEEKLMSSFVAFESEVDTLAPVHDVREKALKSFEKLGFPTKKNEEWKYTPLNSLLKEDFHIFSKHDNTVEFKDVKQYFIHDIDTYKIVFVDGVYNSFLSETTHEGADICLLSAALAHSKYQKNITDYFHKIASKNDAFTSLNTAFAKEGAYIHIPEKKILEKPIQIIHFSTGNDTALMLQPRNLIIVGKQAEVQIIERHQSLSNQKVFTNSVTEIFADQRAQVDYYKIQNDQEEASLIDNTYICQEKESHAKVHTFSFGGKLTRNNLNFYHNDEHIESTLKGITIIENKQLVDHHTLVHHASPNCESHQDYKGIYADTSTGVFNGKVIVEKEAQKTNAFQQNNNILIDDKATINSKPQLEIFADDVKCSHGCTIGQLDEDALFYLRTRGIPKKEAKALLTYAFANNVLESVQIPSVKSRINKIIATKLGVDLGFDV